MFDCIENYVNSYKTSQVLFTMGEDFAYHNASLAYTFIDDIVSYLMSRSDRYNFKYSTVKEYLQSVSEEALRSNVSFKTY